MLYVILSLAAAGVRCAAEEGLDREIVMVGRDESLMDLPALRILPWPPFPAVFPTAPVLGVLPPFFPLSGDWPVEWTGRYPPAPLQPPSGPTSSDALP